MNKKFGIFAIAALFTLSGAILKGTQRANANLVPPTTVTHQNFTDTNAKLSTRIDAEFVGVGGVP